MLSCTQTVLQIHIQIQLHTKYKYTYNDIHIYTDRDTDTNKGSLVVSGWSLLSCMDIVLQKALGEMRRIGQASADTNADKNKQTNTVTYDV